MPFKKIGLGRFGPAVLALTRFGAIHFGASRFGASRFGASRFGTN